MDMPSTKIILVIMLVLAGALILSNPVYHLIFSPTENSAETGLTAQNTDYDVIANNLDVPWEAQPIDGGLLVPERTGDLLLVRNGEQTTLENFEDLQSGFQSEGGLLGVATDPNFEENNLLYVYMTVEDENTENQVVRYRLENESLTDREVLIDGIPSDRIHNGGRIEFGPDEKLYITTGDSNQPDLAQNTESLAGKILRINRDGSIPEENPFNNSVYSYGHRNPQGITWDNEGRMWSTEHGDAATDEINLIDPGENYGWPEIDGNETSEGMQTPVIHSGQEETWAPAGAAYHDDKLFFGGLRGSTLYEAELDDGSVTGLKSHFQEDFGRIRAVTVENESLYLTTSNTDGRGNPGSDDDKVIRIDLDQFN